MANRPVPVPQPRLVIAQRFTPAQASENIVDDSLVRVKFGDVPAEILFFFIPEKIELGLVRPQNGAVGAHPMKADGRGFYEISQNGLATTQGLKFAQQSVLRPNIRRLRAALNSAVSRHLF